MLLLVFLPFQLTQRSLGLIQLHLQRRKREKQSLAPPCFLLIVSFSFIRCIHIIWHPFIWKIVRLWLIFSFVLACPHTCHHLHFTVCFIIFFTFTLHFHFCPRVCRWSVFPVSLPALPSPDHYAFFASSFTQLFLPIQLLPLLLLLFFTSSVSHLWDTRCLFNKTNCNNWRPSLVSLSSSTIFFFFFPFSFSIQLASKQWHELRRYEDEEKASFLFSLAALSCRVQQDTKSMYAVHLKLSSLLSLSLRSDTRCVSGCVDLNSTFSSSSAKFAFSCAEALHFSCPSVSSVEHFACCGLKIEVRAHFFLSHFLHFLSLLLLLFLSLRMFDIYMWASFVCICEVKRPCEREDAQWDAL